TSAWADRSGDKLAAAIAEGATVDRAAETFDPAFDEVAALIPGSSGPENLGLSDEHRLLRGTLRGLAERQLAPRAGAIHRQDLDVPDDVIRGVGELGLFGLSIPEQYGGSVSG